MLPPITEIMKTQRALVSVLLVSFLFCQSLFSYAAPPTSQDQDKPVVLTGGVESFGILTDDLQRELGIRCAKDGAGNVRIQQVHLGTEAYYKGLAAGDIVLNARADANRVYVTINRAGKIYEARLGEETTAVQLRPETARMDAPRQPLQGYAIESGHVRVLSNYNLELIIDRSLSMRRPDCPGGLSRWDWCSNQAMAIAQALSPYVPNGLTVTRFATEFDVHEHATAQDIANILGRHDFQLGTRLCEPLAARLDNFFARHRPGDKPLLIAVITDGVPFPRPEPRMVRDALINASLRMTDPDEVTVVFLQVGGDDPRGERYLVNLGTNLVNLGARFQFVHTKTFEELQATGLARALVDAVSSVASISR